MISNDLVLTDLHRHLDGNIRLDTILELAERYGLDLPAYTAKDLRPHVQVMHQEADLMAFLAKLDWGVKMLASLEACQRVAYENIQDAHAQGLDYVELRFSPGYMAMNHQLPLEGVVEAVIDGIRQGCREYNIQANLIGILSRTFGVTACQHELDALLSQSSSIQALDLAGDELNYPAPLFKAQFAKARDQGWQITVHAGEAAGPQSIWQAILELGATRIGHGVQAIQDPVLMEYLAAHQIGIESCISSNLQTSTVANVREHPLKIFLEHGILASINSDDPAVQGVDILHEYQVAAPSAGLSQAQIRTAQENGLKMAFLSDAEKKALQSAKTEFSLSQI